MTAKKHSKSVPSQHGAICPRFHRAVELVGRRWTGAIIQMLLAQPRRFNEISAAIPGLSDRLLCERLQELEREGLVQRAVDAGPPVKVTYALTKSGLDLDRALSALGKWAHRWIPLPGDRSAPRRKSAPTA